MSSESRRINIIQNYSFFKKLWKAISTGRWIKGIKYSFNATIDPGEAKLNGEHACFPSNFHIISEIEKTEI
jgi:hypothetical protein